MSRGSASDAPLSSPACCQQGTRRGKKPAPATHLCRARPPLPVARMAGSQLPPLPLLLLVLLLPLIPSGENFLLTFQVKTGKKEIRLPRSRRGRMA